MPVALENPVGAPNPVHPLDQMSWNDRVWTPQQAEFLRNNGMSLTDALIDTDFESERAAISNTIQRWPGNTDGDSSRTHLVIPYRMHEGTAFDAVPGAQAFLAEAMAEVGTDYMNGCIEFVDDTDAQAHEFFISIQDDPDGGCVSNVGYLGNNQAGQQHMNYNPGAGVDQGGSCLAKSVITHEFLHALGFNHEQERPDRDDYVIIHLGNILDDKEHNFEKMETAAWFDMSSPYDGQSVMHYSATSFLTQEASDNGLFAITDINTGAGVQYPRVDRMSSEDCFQLQKMYENFCAPLPSRACTTGDQNYLKNRACDGISDCVDGSDETTTICNEVCTSDSIWVSNKADNCLDSDGMAHLGKYDKMTDTLVDGFPRSIKVEIGTAYVDWLAGTYYKLDTVCDGFTEPSYQMPGQNRFLYPRVGRWYFGMEDCASTLNMYYQDSDNGGNHNFWELSPGANYLYWDGAEWQTSTVVTTTPMSLGYDHTSDDLFIFRQSGGNWVAAATIDGTPVETFGSGPCPQGTFTAVKIDYEVGDAVTCGATTAAATTAAATTAAGTGTTAAATTAAATTAGATTAAATTVAATTGPPTTTGPPATTTTTTIAPEILPFAGAWTGDDGSAISIEGDGTITLMDNGNFETFVGTYFEENGDNKIQFDDGEGNIVTGTISEDGSEITFEASAGKFSNATWKSGQLTTVPGTTTAGTTVAVTTAPLTTEEMAEFNDTWTDAGTGLPVTITGTDITGYPGTTGAITIDAHYTDGTDMKIDFMVNGALVTGTLSADGRTISFSDGNSVTRPAAVGATTTAATTTTAGNGYAVMAGDPHVKVQAIGQEAVCFDVQLIDNQCVLLLSDAKNKLAITGKMHNDYKHNRLTVVGVETGDGTQIEVHTTFAVINGISINFDQDRLMHFADVTIQIFSHYKTKHQGLTIFTNFGPAFHISGKTGKESLKFEIESPAGLSDEIDGLLGFSIRPSDYRIENGDIILENSGIITDAERTWMEHSFCHVLLPKDISTFLGVSPDKYGVPELFNNFNSYATLLEEINPK